MIPEKLKWLLQPLRRTMRARLELTLGVVLTGAVVVALSTAIRPDPSKLAHPIVLAPTESSAERRAEAQLKTEAPTPKVAPAFVNAVSRGDLAAMMTSYTPGMALDGMLSVAAEAGQLNAARWLLDHRADVHEDETVENAPILLADAHPAVVALLLERGAVEPSLTTAAQAGAKGAVFRLLAAHASVDGSSQSEQSPLVGAASSTRASAETKLQIATALLDAGANPNRDDSADPLFYAVSACDATAEAATSNECVPLVKLLLKRGARVRSDALVAALALDEPLRHTVLDVVLAARLEPGATAVALARSWNLPPDVLKRVIAKRVDWAWHDGEDDAALPLLAAIQRGDRDFARALLEGGAPLDTRFKDGTCALGEAINGGSNDNADAARIVELLVGRGVDVNRRLPDGRTPLFAAAETGNLRIVNALLARGARLNDLVLDDTALDAAEQNGNQAAARVLHAHGARRAQKPNTLRSRTDPGDP